MAVNGRSIFFEYARRRSHSKPSPPPLIPLTPPPPPRTSLPLRLSVLVQPQPAHHCRHPRLRRYRLCLHPPPPPPPLPPRLPLLSSAHPPALLLSLGVGGIDLITGAGEGPGGVRGADSGAIGVHAGVGGSQVVGGLRRVPAATPSTPPASTRGSVPPPPARSVVPAPSSPPPVAAAQREAKELERSESFRVEIGSISQCQSSAGATPANAPLHGRSYLLGLAFDYLVEEEVEAVVACKLRRPSMNGGARAPAPPGVEVEEAMGERGGSWVRDYIDRLASSASSSFSSLRFSGRHFDTVAVSGGDS